MTTGFIFLFLVIILWFMASMGLFQVAGIVKTKVIPFSKKHLKVAISRKGGVKIELF